MKAECIELPPRFYVVLKDSQIQNFQAKTHYIFEVKSNISYTSS